MRKIVFSSIVVVLLISLVGCGEPEVQEDSYEEFVAEYYQTKLELHMLKIKYAELEASHEREEGRDAEYINAINTLTGENDALRIEVTLIKVLGESQRASLESVLNELVTLRDEKKGWHIFATKEADAILTKYNAILEVYPPVHFASKAELVKWRASSGNMTEVGCLGLQRRALNEGYIVSLHPSFEYCTAVAGDTLYKITPGDKELVEKIRKVE